MSLWYNLHKVEGYVADAQFVAGHVKPQTTLRHAQVKDAKEVKGRIKISY